MRKFQTVNNVFYYLFAVSFACFSCNSSKVRKQFKVPVRFLVLSPPVLTRKRDFYEDSTSYIISMILDFLFLASL